MNAAQAMPSASDTERVARRQPLNLSAPDLVEAAAYTATSLRDEIDYWRHEAKRRHNRLREANRLASMRFHAPGVRVDTPEAAGASYRRAMAVLHWLVELARQQPEGSL